jgi:hypothetical protein
VSRRRAPRCPDCPGSPVAVPLVIGLPSPDAFDAAARGELVLGGCVLRTEDGRTPSWACPACKREFA